VFFFATPTKEPPSSEEPQSNKNYVHTHGEKYQIKKFFVSFTVMLFSFTTKERKGKLHPFLSHKHP
jgi:hypothetical protein